MHQNTKETAEAVSLVFPNPHIPESHSGHCVFTRCDVRRTTVTSNSSS